MATTVNWATKIISVLRADMTLIQSTPTEIRELDINAFRLDLKTLEASEEGMPFLDTHQHNTEVLLGGITYARVIEIINGYTVTFEDGQYAVNLIGANSNVGDVTNVNQVSVRSNNSAGLISSPAIEVSSYNGGVTVDTSLTTFGTAYDLGVPGNPVGNIDDALLIISFRNLSKRLFIIGDATFTTGHDITDFIVEGESPVKSTITIDPGAIVDGVEFENATIIGTLDNNASISFCSVGTLSFFEGTISNTELTAGTIILGGSQTSHFINCYSGTAGATNPIIDVGSGKDVVIVNYSNGLTIINKTGSDNISANFVSGRLKLSSSCINGNIVVSGIVRIFDFSGSSCVVNTDGVLNRNLLRDIRNSVEMFRPHHTGTGNTYYWDPVNGNDANDGVTVESATKTFVQAHNLVLDGNHDVITCVPGQIGAPTVADEIILITKRFVFLRGPGRDFQITPSDDTQPTICVTNEGAEISGLVVNTASSGSNFAIKIDGSAGGQTANFALIKNIWMDQISGSGISINDSEDTVIDSIHIDMAGGNGVEINDNCRHISITGDNHISGCVGDGIALIGTNIEEFRVIGHTEVERNSGYGINIGSGATHTHLHSISTMLSGNILGNFIDNGESTDWGDELFNERTNRKVINVIESHRKSHTGMGNVFYVDPVNGDTHANGARGTWDTPYNSIQGCHDNVVADSNHDLILIVPGAIGGPTTITEDVTISKRFLFIRGTGPDIIWTRSGAGNTITVTAEGCEFSGFQLTTDSVGAGHGIDVNGANNTLISGLFIKNVRGNAIRIRNSDSVIVKDNLIHDTGLGGTGNGVVIDSAGGTSNHCEVKNNHIGDIVGDGIQLKGPNVEHTEIIGNRIHECTNYAVSLIGNVHESIITDNRWGFNVAGNLNDGGTDTLNVNNEQWSTYIHSENIMHLVESQRGRHTGHIFMYHWDPVNGSDDNDGLTDSTAKLTWNGVTGVNSLIFANNHDIIFIHPGEVGGTTVITEQIVIDKEYTFLRGPGRDVVFRPTATTDATISVDAEGVELSGIRVETAATGDGVGIEINGDFCWVHNVHVENTMDDGIRLQNISRAKLEDVIVRLTGGDGVVLNGSIQDCKFNRLTDINIQECAGNGIRMYGANCQYNLIWGGEEGDFIAYNGGWGIIEDSGANLNHVIGPTISVHDNALGMVSLSGASSEIQNIEQWSTHTPAATADAVWDEATSDHLISGSFGEYFDLLKKDIARMLGLANENTEWSDFVYDSSVTPPRVLSAKINLYTELTLTTRLTDSTGNVVYLLTQSYDSDGSTKELSIVRTT